MNLYFQVKKTTQKLLVFLGLIGVIWWAIICDMAFGSYINIPLFHYIVYILFLASTGSGIYGWIKTVRIEKEFKHLTDKTSQ